MIAFNDVVRVAVDTTLDSTTRGYRRRMRPLILLGLAALALAACAGDDSTEQARTSEPTTTTPTTPAATTSPRDRSVRRSHPVNNGRRRRDAGRRTRRTLGPLRRRRIRGRHAQDPDHQLRLQRLHRGRRPAHRPGELLFLRAAHRPAHRDLAVRRRHASHQATTHAGRHRHRRRCAARTALTDADPGRNSARRPGERIAPDRPERPSRGRRRR